MGKLLIVGLDALSWPLVVHGGERWPFFNTLNGQMFYSGVPTTGPGWTSIMTGWEAEKHKITQVWGVAKEEGECDFLTTPAPYFWERMPLSVGLVGVPTLYDAFELNGWVISGPPGVEAKVWPTELKEYIDPEYLVDADTASAMLYPLDQEHVADIVGRPIDPRMKTALAFYNKHPADILFFTFTYLDRLGHSCGKLSPIIGQAQLGRGYSVMNRWLELMCWWFFGFEKLVVVSDHGWLGKSHSHQGFIGGINVDLDGVTQTHDFVPWLYRELGLGKPDLSPNKKKRQSTSGALTEEEKEEIEARLKGWGY